MSNIIHKSDTTTINLDHHSGTEEHLLTADQLPSQKFCNYEFDLFWEPPVVLDEEAEAAYRVWQESLSYLQEDIERL
jgi:hypothetical protein